MALVNLHFLCAPIKIFYSRLFTIDREFKLRDQLLSPFLASFRFEINPDSNFYSCLNV